MDMKKSKKLLAYLAAAYWALVILIYLVAHPQFRYTSVASDSLSPSMTVGEVVDGMELEQTVVVPANELREISLMTATYGRENQGEMILALSDKQGNVLTISFLQHPKLFPRPSDFLLYPCVRLWR